MRSSLMLAEADAPMSRLWTTWSAATQLPIEPGATGKRHGLEGAGLPPAALPPQRPSGELPHRGAGSRPGV